GRRAQVEAGVQVLHVVQLGDVDAGVDDLAVDVRARRGVLAVQGDAVERGGQARGGLADREVMEAAVGALGRAFAGEHADRVLAGAAVGVHAAGVGVAARQVLLAQEHQQLAPALVGGGGDLGDLLVAEGFAVVLDADGFVADLVFGDFVGDGLEARGPVAEVAEVFAGQRLYGVVVALAQGQESAVPLTHQVVAAVEVQGLGELVVAELVQGLPEGLGAGGGFGLLFNARVERAALLGDLGQVADAGAGDEAGGAGFAQAGVDAGIEVAARTCSCRLRGYSRPYSRFAEDFFAQ